MNKEFFKKNKIILILSALLVIALLVIAFLLGRETKTANVNNYQSGVEGSNHEKVIEKRDNRNLDDGEDETENKSSEVSEKKEDSKEESSTKETTTKASVKEYSSVDKEVIEEVEEIEKDTEEALKSDDTKTFTQKAKGVFISLVDFIFYDGKIKGHTFNELTDAGKEKVLKLANSIDEKIEKKIPNYKESISSTASSAFKSASETIKEGANKFSSFSREKLGEKNYNAIIAAKDDLVTYTKAAASILKDFGSSAWSTVKDKVKTWYENFRSKNAN